MQDVSDIPRLDELPAGWADMAEMMDRQTQCLRACIMPRHTAKGSRHRRASWYHRAREISPRKQPIEPIPLNFLRALCGLGAPTRPLTLIFQAGGLMTCQTRRFTR